MKGAEDVERKVKIKEVRENKRSGEQQRDRGQRKITDRQDEKDRTGREDSEGKRHR